MHYWNNSTTIGHGMVIMVDETAMHEHSFTHVGPPLDITLNPGAYFDF